jgi:hypothetical protein
LPQGGGGGSAGHIYCVALDMRPEIAKQIVREHNAHGDLVELAKYLKDHICFDGYDCKGNGIERRVSDYEKTQLERIDAVLARAEGSE